uniref:Uncharacterized protein n=1 Tax=Arcella intermedia TaxID=1963864 RepID=A0A6B2L569_9EUKA
MLANDILFTHLEWTLSMIERPEVHIHNNPGHCEMRTCIKYSNEEHVAPAIFKIETEVAETIFKAIAQNSTILSLKLTGHSNNLRNNFTPNISDNEIPFLVDALKQNTTLTSLDLSCNSITSTGAKLLSSLFRDNKTFKKINLNHNFIMSDGIYAIAQNLQANKCIEQFSIASQLTMNLSRSTVLSSHPYDRSLLSLIEDSLKRRSELLTGSLPGYHGVLTPKEAESRMREFINGQNKGNYVGVYLVYIRPSAPGRVYFCYVGKNQQAKLVFLHQPVFRGRYGYLSSRSEDIEGTSRQLIQIPSLTSHCAWFIGIQPHWKNYISSLNSQIPYEIQRKIQDMEDLVDLWRVTVLPEKQDLEVNGGKLGGYPTLKAFIHRNKSQFKQEVPPKEPF